MCVLITQCHMSRADLAAKIGYFVGNLSLHIMVEKTLLDHKGTIYAVRNLLIIV